MENKKIDIEAEICVLTFEQGGRSKGNHIHVNGYYPIFKYKNFLNDVFLFHPNKKLLKLGEQTNINIKFKFPCLQLGRLLEGDEFELTEGSRTTITGKILKIKTNLMSEVSWKTNLSRSIEDLEQTIWKDLEEYPSSIVENCHILRKKKISKLENEELRTLISQNVGTEFTIPVIIRLLIRDLFIECDFYPGDLLKAVVSNLEKDWGRANYFKDDFIFILRARIKEIEMHNEMPKKVKSELLEYLK